ncbi:MAG: class I SAM-dependent methyltransferase [Flavobacteriaceae bacterium]|nr:class I SAM-dependent methyltransferase [Flavobacteriaceae bacterium]
MKSWLRDFKDRLYPIWAFGRFIIRSRNKHGVHSPFVYDLLTQVLSDTSKYSDYVLLDQFRSTLRHDTSFIEITDFGAGSRIFKSNRRQVKQLVRHVGATPYRQKLLWRLANHFEPIKTLELGTHLGLGTAALQLGCLKGTVTSVEGCPALAKHTAHNILTLGLEKARIIPNRFEDFLKGLEQEKFDLIYVDGNHTQEATLSYFNQLKNHCHQKSIMIFDDIHWSAEMSQAWALMQKDPSVTVSIDLFFWGLIFFRPGQVKEHFVLRV